MRVRVRASGASGWEPNARRPDAGAPRKHVASACAPLGAARLASFPRVIFDEEVAAALRARRGVVALESTLIAHGLPAPDNLRVAREAEAAVRAAGAVPATIAVVGGVVRIGLDDDALAAVALGADVVKAGVRDLAPAVARGIDAATTVASTAHLAALAGIGVFATGGLGGVHRGARESWDESADLTTLARTAIVVVSAGVKSILDVTATLERLETLNVTVVGYRTDAFPGFYLSDSGHPVPWRVESADEVAAVMRARADLGLGDRAIVVANPLPPDEQLDPALHDRVLRESLAAAAAAGVAGREVTPFLLDRFHRETGGASLDANVRLVLRNAALAGEIAVAAAGA
jgi:pseudouridine-5'-phosphate glycosidase